MSLAERDQLILTILFSIIGFILLVFLICCSCWRIIRSYHLKIKQKHQEEIYQRKYYSTKMRQPIYRKTKKRQKRSNTTDSTISMSFNPPHLINQNVKNLEKFLQNESTLTANSWSYEETLPKKTCSYSNSSIEPIYASSSTVLTSISNSLTENRNELDQILHVKQPLKYSQSCRQTHHDFFAFDYHNNYHHSRSSPSTITETNSLEPIYIRTNRPTNATLLRKIRLAQIRDDTAILY